MKTFLKFCVNSNYFTHPTEMVLKHSCSTENLNTWVQENNKAEPMHSNTGSVFATSVPNTVCQPLAATRSPAWAVSGGLWQCMEGLGLAENISLLCQPSSNKIEAWSRLGSERTRQELARHAKIHCRKVSFSLYSEIVQIRSQQNSTS